ncbi:hypothetical protein [Ruania alba]|uniref:hypothetical protein n=1 Tax=Ruania alba TaxID=648782 RepID=UPI000AB6D9B1|nr:hypothetical protein [Ruania alba]
MANFPDWSDTFLSTAELAHACAMGYDWLYHRLSHDQRDLIRGAIVELGLKQGLVEYRDSDRHGNSPPWSTVTGNWNFVGNAGMAAGALAIGDEEPEVAEEVLRSSLDSVAIAAAEFAPDGAWPEGMGYWDTPCAIGCPTSGPLSPRSAQASACPTRPASVRRDTSRST